MIIFHYIFIPMQMMTGPISFSYVCVVVVVVFAASSASNRRRPRFNDLVRQRVMIITLECVVCMSLQRSQVCDTDKCYCLACRHGLESDRAGALFTYARTYLQIRCGWLLLVLLIVVRVNLTFVVVADHLGAPLGARRP